jgi:hypothetical protein
MALANLLMRDYVVLKKGDTVTCVADENLISSGWRGGVFLSFADAAIVDGKAVPVVTLSDGINAGPLAMWGSDEPEDTQISYTGQYKRYRYVQCSYGNQIFMTRNFETVSYFDRTGLSTITDKYGNDFPVIDATSFSLEYKAGQTLYVSERGFLTPEKICESSLQWGIVFAVPGLNNSNFLGVANVF